MICLSLTLVSCDPEALVNSYFEQMGLTRLAVLRTDVQPGTIILMKGREGFVMDSFLEYVDQDLNPSHTYDIVGGSAWQDIKAKLPKFSGQTKLSGNLAMQFLAGMFRLGPQVNFGLAKHVTVAIPDMKVKKMTVASLENFLKHDESAPFEKKVRDWIQQGLTPYVAYEVFRAKTVTVSTKNGQDVAPSLTVGTLTPLPVEAEVGVSSKKVSATELVVAGYRYYAFAVKTARLRWGVKAKSVIVDSTDRAAPTGHGAKGERNSHDGYAAPLVEGFKPVTLQSGLPPDL